MSRSSAAAHSPISASTWKTGNTTPGLEGNDVGFVHPSRSTTPRQPTVSKYVAASTPLSVIGLDAPQHPAGGKERHLPRVNI